MGRAEPSPGPSSGSVGGSSMASYRSKQQGVRALRITAIFFDRILCLLESRGDRGVGFRYILRFF